MKPKTYCEKWPVGCQFCDLLLCDGKKETELYTELYTVTTMNKAGVPGEVLTFEYTHKCEPCKPTQPECGECEFGKPQTNADRIRAMTDEELAKFIASQRTDCYHCPVMECVDACKVSWLNWLKSPADKEVEEE
ncbi:MAG: hypothetical protein J6S14_19805 [Clostridia bacterium]|nr:hypothetical protein [Clostridia bacterium]